MFKEARKTVTTWFGRPSDNQTEPPSVVSLLSPRLAPPGNAQKLHIYQIHTQQSLQLAGDTLETTVQYVAWLPRVTGHQQTKRHAHQKGHPGISMTSIPSVIR
jgi:hypothetical protein